MFVCNPGFTAQSIIEIMHVSSNTFFCQIEKIKNVLSVFGDALRPSQHFYHPIWTFLELNQHNYADDTMSCSRTVPCVQYFLRGSNQRPLDSSSS